MGNGRGPRIAPGGRAEIGLVNAAFARAAGLVTKGEPPRIFTTLGRHRGLFRRWLWFAAVLMPGGKLPREETELVILRVAHNTGSEYEWSQHERMGKRAGLSEEEISRVRAGADAPGWSERRALLLRAADAMHEQRQIGTELWDELSRHLDEVLLIELCMLIGHYEMLAMTLNTLEVEPESPARL
ncbi:MAG TPA: carboxymuconolactone decarboxylase family protein [Solirubrobacterales bacterium]|nr:carboxymuconolactone decarboxylase family protein [Solirubrobacterales bacterium]